MPVAIRLGLAATLVGASLFFANDAFSAAQPARFLVFDSLFTPQMIQDKGAQYQFVWGSTSNPQRDQAWQQYAPATRRSTYFPFERDPNAKSPEVWAQEHPDWVAYRCDGEPAFLYGHPIVPFDIANSEVVQWQLGKFRQAPMKIVALDNFQTQNYEQICGYKSSRGNFVQRYKGSSGNLEFSDVKLKWLEQVASALHSDGKETVVNYTLDVPPESAVARRIVAAVDGVVNEDEGRILSKRESLENYLSFARILRQSGKSYYSIFQLSKISRSGVMSAMAAYLLGAGSKSAVYVSGTQRYGGEPNFLGFDRAIGEPCEENKYRDGWYSRNFSKGVVVVREPGAAVADWEVADGLRDEADQPIKEHSLSVAGGVGLIFYRSAEGCRR